MTFNGEQVGGSPFLCRVTDDGDDDGEEGIDGIAPPDFMADADADAASGDYGRVSVCVHHAGALFSAKNRF